MTASPSAVLARIKRSPSTLHVVILAALAYIPALTAHPGKMPTDTKLYLYFDPARLTGDAPFSWDARQFAGWVPHQTVSYLWPSGPWYSFFSWIGAPDWVAQRLWIGTLMLLGGLGMRWAAKQLGLSATGALIAAMFYQLSPYVLPYISRTSTMLLPWTGLGWLVGLTIRAATRSRWRDIGLFGLVMATVAATNATAILMIAPAPVLWLLHAGWGRIITWRTAAITAIKIGAISALASLWWIAMLSVQGKFGADVLGYSESLEAVSLTSTSPEVLRGMGYWLFYVRDPIGFTTTASFDYMTSGRLIAISFAVLGIGLLGLVCTKWVSRRYAVLLVFVGVVLAVGVHPIDNASPLMAPFAHNSRSSIALALRSSTRALPLSTFGFALGAGALVTALASTRLRLRRFVPWLAGLLAVLNLPVLFNGGFVDINLIRDQDPPAAWTDASAALDAGPSGYRVFQLPGSEFGAFRWGYTVDPPLPGLTGKPLVTRDLLPLGSPATMDLMYALDDRFQEGSAQLSEVAPIARLLGVDTIWLPNDIAFERFRTPRPELIENLFSQGDPGLGAPDAYGPPTPNIPSVAMVDEQSISQSSIGVPLPAVQLVPVKDPQPIMRAKTGTVVVAGSGDGLVDAAAAGLVSGNELIRYSADLIADDQAATIGSASRVIVTDSNRDRAHQWRSSQDVWGFTEDGAASSGVLEFDSADQRTPVFPNQTSDDMTIAEQRGPVVAAASGYGTPSAYLPEDRASLAVDGNIDTAWLVADRADAVGEYIRLDADQPMSQITLVQPQDPLANRWITKVTITDEQGTTDVDLTDQSRTTDGQVIELPNPTEQITLTIAATANDPVAQGEGLDGVGFAEISTGLGPTEEVIRVPSNVLTDVDDDQPLDVVLTRLRTRASNRWRGDPERSLTRSFTLDSARDFHPTVTSRLDQRADDGTIAELIGWTGTTANRRLAGVPAMGGWAATDGDPATSWVTPFEHAVGSTLTVPLTFEPTVSSLTLQQPASDQLAVITQIDVSTESGTRTVDVPAPDADGNSTVSFEPLSGTSLDVTIAATNGATTLDRRYAETTPLPAAISELTGNGIAPMQIPPDLDTGCRDDILTIDGVPMAAQIRGSIDELFAGQPAVVTMCGTPVALTLGTGEHVLRSTSGLDTGLDIDQVVLSSAGSSSAAAAVSEPPKVTLVDSSHTSRTVVIDPCTTDCWFVFGEGFNDGWDATIDGKSLGAQSQVDGGFNGWLLPPSTTPRTIELTWQGQSRLTIGIILSALGVLLCIALVVFDRRRLEGYEPDTPVLADLWGRPSSESPYRLRSPATVCTITALVAGALVITPAWGLICGVVAFVCSFLLRRPRLVGVAAVVVSVYIGLVVLRRVTTLHPFANAGWPGNFEDLHHLGMTVVVFLLAAAVAPRASRPPVGSH